MADSTIFRNRDFLLLWSGNTASNIGLHGARIAYPLLTLILTDSAVATSWVSFMIALPSLLFEVPAGVAADYRDRRRILIRCQTLGLIATLVAAAVILLRPPGLSLFLAVSAFVEGTAYVFFQTSELGVVRDVVTAEQRPGAFAMIEVQQPIGNMMGRTLGAAMLGLARSLPFLANAASYGYCLWALSHMRARVPSRPVVAGPAAGIWDWNSTWAGARALWNEPFVRQSTLTIGCTNAIFQILILLLTIKVRAGGHSVWAIGVVLGATGVGGMLGAAVATKLVHRVSLRVMFTCSLWAWAILCALITASSSVVVFAVCWLGVGFVAAIGNIALTLHRVQAFPEDLVGRVYAATKLIAHTGSAVGALLAGALLTTLGFGVTGWMLVATMVVLARRARRFPEPRTQVIQARPTATPRPANWITQLSRGNGIG
ncbi:MFS transporter [Nocardia sp. NPDC059091]|uniref:MFS transporter n=1 Tax=unclassified Nocardia TaxID=2637762 RepID=UPI0036C95CB0